MYFAKLLPTEDEIKEGDMYWNPRRKRYYIADADDDYETLNSTIRIKHGKPYQKVKLYLCSRDIQAGDKVVNEQGQEVQVPYLKLFDPEDVVHSMGYYKVIGEISPEATWVKEGDEFDENEVMALEAGMLSVRKPIHLIRPEYRIGGEFHVEGYPKIYVKDSNGEFK